MDPRYVLLLISAAHCEHRTSKCIELNFDIQIPDSTHTGLALGSYVLLSKNTHNMYKYSFRIFIVYVDACEIACIKAFVGRSEGSFWESVPCLCHVGKPLPTEPSSQPRPSLLVFPSHSAVWRDHTDFEPYHGCDHTCPGHWCHDSFLLDV